MAGSPCPHCGEKTFFNKDNHKQCSTCESVGWEFSMPVKKVGMGRGKTCPWCGNLTLHDIVETPSGDMVRRCSICNYTLIDPNE